jgi:hypothetical protein
MSSREPNRPSAGRGAPAVEDRREEEAGTADGINMAQLLEIRWMNMDNEGATGRKFR